jgi:hypothetical protein
MRREGLDLKTAARMAGTTPNTMLRHLSPRALRKGPDGRWRATRTDTFERRMQMQTTVGAQSVRPRNSREASLIAHHANAIRLFLNGRPEGERLVGAFAGKRAAGFEFETDLDVLEDEALRGELTAESIYETTH